MHLSPFKQKDIYEFVSKNIEMDICYSGYIKKKKGNCVKFWKGVEWWLEHRFQQLEELGWKENNSILYSFSIGGFKTPFDTIKRFKNFKF